MTPNVRRQSQALIEAMEAIRAHCAATAPELAGGMGEAELPPGELPAGERGMLLLAAAADLPMDAPEHRRRARRLFQEAREAMERGDAVGGVAGLEKLGGRRGHALEKGLRWVMGKEFAEALAAVPGPLGAVRLVRSAVPGLTFTRAARFLQWAGHDCAVPTLALRRWLHRFGLLESTEGTEAGLRHSLQALNDLSIQGAVPLGELAHLLALFSGGDPRAGRETAVCAARPRCGACPALPWCPTGQAAKRLGLEATGVEEDGRLVMKALPAEDRPREKLLRRGTDHLTDAELLAILLRTGGSANGRKLHALELAQHLLTSAGSLDRLADLSIEEMRRTGHAGEVQAVTIKAALELARRLSAPQDPPDDQPLNNARLIFHRMRGRMLDRRVEHFHVLHLDIKNRLIREVVISKGIVNQSLVHPREAFKEALRDAATGVIFVHNHPTGDPAPSRQDFGLTRRLVQAGDILGIPVLDHVIIGRDRYYSFADEGMLRAL